MAKTITLQRPAPAGTTTFAAPTVPPPASPPPGTTGSPPLPMGRAVVGINPSKLTAAEQRELKRVGWRDGEPIPSNMAQIVEQVRLSAEQEHLAALNQPPIDPRTPPVVLKVTDAAGLPAAKQEEVRQTIAQALAHEQATAAQQQAEAMALNNPPPAVAGPILDAQKLDEPAPAPAPAPAFNPDAVRTEEPVAPMTHCPNCSFDLKMPAIPEPPPAERAAFLHSQVLGDKPYVKTYHLLGGHLVVAFRTLHIRELDACFKQALAEEKRGDIETKMDFLERVSRFRLYLQLASFHTAKQTYELPNGLSRDTNPNAEAFWEFPPEEKEPLLLIEKWMLDNVLGSESISRIVTQNCAQFNRLVAKMEVMFDNPDFWKATSSLV